jgi:hypothetical protein
MKRTKPNFVTAVASSSTTIDAPVVATATPGFGMRTGARRRTGLR